MLATNKEYACNRVKISKNKHPKIPTGCGWVCGVGGRLGGSAMVLDPPLIMIEFSFTESEGVTPIHTVVLYRGRFFCMDMVDEQEEPLTPPEIQQQLTLIKDQCDRETPGLGLGALTGETRKKWAEVGIRGQHNQHLI